MHLGSVIPTLLPALGRAGPSLAGGVKEVPIAQFLVMGLSRVEPDPEAHF